MFRTVPLFIISSFFTVHTAVVYVILVCWQLASSQDVSMEQAVGKPVWHIPLLCVQWKFPDNVQRNCPKHVQIYSKNKFEKLVHLVGFIIRIYYDAPSPERQIMDLINEGKMKHIKIINAQQAKSTYAYKNTKQKLLKWRQPSGSIKCVD